MTWSTSDRRSRLPSDWPKRRQQVKRRARGLCEAEQHEPDCNGIGTECDHIVNNDDHSLSNLQWLSTPCHKAKTQRESRAWRQPKARPRPAHPGLL